MKIFFWRQNTEVHGKEVGKKILFWKKEPVPPRELHPELLPEGWKTVNRVDSWYFG